MAQAGRRWEEVAAAARRLDELRPGAPEGALRLATSAFRAEGSTREMQNLLARLTIEKADDALVIVARRNLALMRGDLAEFVADRLNLTVNLVNVAQVFPVAFALAAQGKASDARAMFADAPAMLRRRLEREPENPNAWSDLGMVAVLQGHNEEALHCVRRAVELVPEATNPYFGPIYRIDLAIVQAWIGDRASALAEFTRLLQVPMTQSGQSRNAQTLNVHVMRHHPFYFPLQGDPSFEALLNDPKNNAPLF